MSQDTNETASLTISWNTGIASSGEPLFIRKNIRTRRLPRQRGLRFIEPPRVLDRNHRVIGKPL
ncbi:MAG: hypothetical protein AAF727_07435 [Pseudomonadota bacterium]